MPIRIGILSIPRIPIQDPDPDFDFDFDFDSDNDLNHGRPLHINEAGRSAHFRTKCRFLGVVFCDRLGLRKWYVENISQEGRIKASNLPTPMAMSKTPPRPLREALPNQLGRRLPFRTTSCYDPERTIMLFFERSGIRGKIRRIRTVVSGRGPMGQQGDQGRSGDTGFLMVWEKGYADNGRARKEGSI
ncbi:MAG TPA: hypothetical protein DEW46_02975 [Verrucomicrobia bacterium]|nr:hypothetical protein [Verrucomicrobiota bacterium]